MKLGSIHSHSLSQSAAPALGPSAKNLPNCEGFFFFLLLISLKVTILGFAINGNSETIYRGKGFFFFFEVI